jgi:hypothetical protein
VTAPALEITTARSLLTLKLRWVILDLNRLYGVLKKEKKLKGKKGLKCARSSLGRYVVRRYGRGK